MRMRILLSAALVAALPFAATAAPISMDSQLDIVGTLNRANSDFSPAGKIDFEGDGVALIATGDFSSIVTSSEAAGVPASPTFFALNDIDFASPGVVYQGGGFTFTATAFSNFDNVFPGRSFFASGTISSTMFDDTPGYFAISTQATGNEVRVSFSSTTTPVPVPAAGLLLLGGLGGLGGLAALRRRRNEAHA